MGCVHSFGEKPLILLVLHGLVFGMKFAADPDRVSARAITSVFCPPKVDTSRCWENLGENSGQLSTPACVVGKCWVLQGPQKRCNEAQQEAWRSAAEATVQICQKWGLTDSLPFVAASAPRDMAGRLQLNTMP